MKVLELFAGVGGFRIGLENADKKLFETKGQINGSPLENLKMPLKFIIIIFLIVKILILVSQTSQTKHSLKWMLT